MRVSDLGLPTTAVAPVVTPVNGKTCPGQTTAAATSGHAGESSQAVQKQRPLHRLAQVRMRQGVSLRTMARRMKVDVRTVREEEDPTRDLPLSVLYRWQKALQVPLIELFSDIEEPLSAPVLKRARLLRMMKTIRAIQLRAKQPVIRQLAELLAEQLLEIMPELADVNPWPSGRRRRTSGPGPTSDRVFKLRFR
jgi:transcriptional regulator with XRE-family HTH domain